MNVLFRIIIGLVLVLAVLCGIIYWCGKNSVSKEKIMKNYRSTLADSRYMLHALGGMNGTDSYTNSIDALEKNYADGYRLFEVDVNLTSDHKVVLVHGWNKKDYKQRIGMENYNQEKADEKGRYVPDYDEFMQFRIMGKYKASSFGELMDFMRKHRDMYVMIDVGNRTYDDTCDIYQAMVDAADSDDRVLQRLIVGGHTKDMISAVKSTYDFSLYNLYFAAESKREPDLTAPEDFIAYCDENDITSFSVAGSVYTQEVASVLDKSDLICYVFTVNDAAEAEKFFNMGVEITGTDFLR